MTDRDPMLSLRELVSAPMTFLMLLSATNLGIADLVTDGPRSAEELAVATGTMPGPIRRLMRALAANEIFAERTDGRFEHTPLSLLVQRDTPGSMRNIVLMFGGPQLRAWLDLEHSLRTGQTAFDHVFGSELFEYLAAHPEAGEVFNRAMEENTRTLGQAVAGACDFSRFDTLMDVGGGTGELMKAILERYPSLRGIIFDLPHVVETAVPRITEAGLADRCATIGGSFFEEIGSGADAIIMKAIIHDWDDDKCRVILDNCRKALPADGRLLVVDRVMPDRIEPGPAARFATFMDMNMMVNPGGRERTADEFERLLAASGFKMAGTTDVFMGLSIIEAVPAE